MAWDLNLTGDENGNPCIEATADGTVQRLQQGGNLAQSAEKDAVIHWVIRAFFPTGYVGDFDVGADQLDGDDASLALIFETILNASITKNAWANYSGSFTLTHADTASYLPYVSIPTSATTGVVKVMTFEMGPIEPGATNGGVLGLNIVDENAETVSDINAKNRFTATDNMITDPYFADGNSAAWDLTSGFTRALTGEITDTPCLTATGDGTNQSFLTSDNVDVLIPAVAGETINLKARVNRTTNTDDFHFFIELIEYDGTTSISTTNVGFGLSIPSSAWTTVLGTYRIPTTSAAHYIRIGFRMAATNTSGVCKVQWIAASKPDAGAEFYTVTRVMQADSSKTSTTALGTESDLDFDVDAGFYHAKWVLYVNGYDGGDFRFGMPFSGFGTLLGFYRSTYLEFGKRITDTELTSSTDLLIELFASYPGRDQLVEIELFLEVTSNQTFSLNWAQKASYAFATIVKEGSYMEVTKLK